MRIQHNIMAMNAYRNYNTNTSALSKNLEKLSSGYKINRAGDDAAGLAISEKMRAQITGLEGAQSNAKDGISLVQTAEGALTEVHDMLNRMYELAEQSANGTYENEVDRMQLQKEVSNLTAEIDRISKASNFNGIKLLDGSLAEAEVDVTAATIAGTDGTIATVAADPGVTTVSSVAAGTAAEHTYTVQYKDDQGNLQKVEVKYTGDTTAATNAANIANALKNSALANVFEITAASDDITFTAKVAGKDGAEVMKVTTSDTGKSAGTVAHADGADEYMTVAGLDADGNNVAANDSVTINGKTYEFVTDASQEVTNDGATAVLIGATDTETIANLNKALESAGIKAEIDAADNLKLSALKDGTGLSLQIGDTGDDFNQLTVSVKACDSTSIGVANVDISTQEGAQAALETIKSAINYVSDVRGGLGAIQNRLDHTINNLSVMQENIQDAESSIRDTDIADEMMDYTKNNILIQSAQAMLAQANQVPQGVLQLLQ